MCSEKKGGENKAEFHSQAQAMQGAEEIR